jgi:hypothetical protein
MKEYHLPATRHVDDFDQPITRQEGEALYDAPTVYRGTWALMTQVSWEYHRKSARLGTGRGQKYVCAADGKYRKVEG